MTTAKIKEVLELLQTNQPSFGDTRGDESASFFESISVGLSANGGLFMPKEIPDVLKKIPGFFEDILPSLTISETATILHRIFIPQKDIGDEELGQMMKKAYSFNIPIENIGDNTFIARLDEGPTASFKDFAARSISQLLNKYSEVNNKPINIVVATSGDTGVAIADAFGNAKNITVTVMYPDGGVSEVQEKQMLGAQKNYKNVKIIPIKGNFDNCQDIAKTLQLLRDFNDLNISEIQNQISYKLGQHIETGELKKIGDEIKALNLSSANSINIWRLIPQMLQYFVSYAILLKDKKILSGEEVVFAVPTGNVGHIMAGIFAKELGLPIKKFIMGTNANNIMANIIGSGVIKHKEFTNTSAPSMDILDPSNLERLLYFVAKKIGNTEPIRYEQMKKDIKNSAPFTDISLSSYGVTKEMLTYLQKLIWAEDTETNEEIYAMMSYEYQKNNIVLEPHGVAAFIATIRTREKKALARDTKVIVFETAHPDKFPSALREAFLEKAPHRHHKELEKLKEIDLKDMRKGEICEIDLIKIARKIKTLAER